MCLTIKSKLKTADRDIVCFKALNSEEVIDFTVLTNGEPFKATICGQEVEGVIFMEGCFLFFCTNNPECDGMTCSNKYGYKYSWAYDCNVKNLWISEKKIPTKIQYKTPFRDMLVEVGQEYDSKLGVRLYYVDEGFHSFQYKEDAVSYGDIIAECIIPKGAQYFEGTFDDFSGYASTKIKYVKLCV